MTRLRDRFASLTSRLVLTTVALILVATTLIGTATTAAMRSYLTDQLDTQVHDTLSRMLRGPGGPGLGNEIGTVTGVFPTHGASSSSVVEDSSTGRPRTTNLSHDATAAIDDVPADGEVHSVEIPGLGSYRVVAEDLPDGTLVVGSADRRRRQRPVRPCSGWRRCSRCWPCFAGGGVAFVVVRRQLRPLREVAATAHRWPSCRCPRARST